MNGGSGPKTDAQRQDVYRKRRTASGLKEVRNLWVHPDDEQAIRQYAAKLAAKRACTSLTTAT